MASRSFDGKAAWLFREGRQLTSTLWRHLADSGRTAGGGEQGGRGEKRKRNGRYAFALTEGIEKNTTLPTGLWGLKRVDWGAGNQSARPGQRRPLNSDSQGAHLPAAARALRARALWRVRWRR